MACLNTLITFQLISVDIIHIRQTYSTLPRAITQQWYWHALDMDKYIIYT